PRGAFSKLIRRGTLRRRFGLSSRISAGSILRPRLLPEPDRDWKRINVESPDPADRHHELVAHSASEGTRLCKGEVMRVRRHAAAHQAGLPQHESPMVLIAQANRFAQSLD